MSLVTFAVVNGALAIALLAALAYVCSLPFRLERSDPVVPSDALPRESDAGYERLAA
jgi:hypothetical protein